MRSLVFAVALTAALSAAPTATGQPLKPAAGEAAPPLELADLAGKMHRLSDYRGRAVLINFWATWCAPCREEMPGLERLRASLEGRPFALLAVNLAEPESRVRAFLREVPVGFPVLLDRDAKASKAWRARMLPATYVVGPDGAVRYVHHGELDWSSPEVRRAILALVE